MQRTIWTTAGILAASTMSMTVTFAQGRHYAPQGDYVVAESHFGKGTVSGPVRPGSRGWQVRLPGGSWIDCERNCSDTLRRQTVDFWENNGPQSKESNSPGYFRWGFGRRY